MTNTGKPSEKIFTEAMGLTKRWVHRFRDMKDVKGLNRGKNLAMFPCPSDFIVGGSEGLFMAEVKSVESKDSFSYAGIRPAQRSAAGMASAFGFPYFFFVHSLKDDTWYVLTAEELVSDIKAGKKSRSFKELTPCSLMSWSM